MVTAPPSLIALSPGDLTHPRQAQQLLGRLRLLREGGLRGFLLREPGLSDRDLLELARELRRIFDRDQGTWLAVHDKLHVALSAEADAVHLGFRSLSPLAAKAALGTASISVGLSTHAADDAQSWDAADYLFHGPVFETPSKQGLVEPIGPEGLVIALKRRPNQAVPLLALGGIKPDNLRAVLDTGVHGAAVLGALQASPAENLAAMLACH